MSFLRTLGIVGCTCSMLWLSGCGGGTSSSTTPPTPPGNFQLQVQASGSGTGTVSSTPSGISCGKTCTATFQQGTQVTLTATPGSGSTFAGWGGACSGMDTCTVTLNKNMSATASFAPTGTPEETLTVTLGGQGTGSVTSAPSGINCGTMCGAQFPQGTKVTLTETATNGSTFAGWSGSCSGSGPTCAVTLSQNTSVTASFTPPSPPPMETLTVNVSPAGYGTVSSNPAGINSCSSTCNASFPMGTVVTLTETATPPNGFNSWSGGCTGTGSTCQVAMTTNETVTATFNPPGMGSINHIIFFAQENRSFDSYFGAMRAYWAANGIPDQSFDGLPQFNPLQGPGVQPPYQGAPPTNPGCDPSQPPPADCSYDPSNPVTSYHLITQCIENPSPFWNEAHVNWDYNDQTGIDPYVGNGFVWAAGHDSRAENYYDVNGVRVMGYYDWTDLNYYYFMATDFATSDRWFNPAMTRTEPNRQYILSATSHGYVYPIGSNGETLLPNPPIFAELQSAGISWKIYVNPGTTCPGPPYQTSCLVSLSYISNFTWQSNVQYPTNIGTIGPAGTCGSSPCDFENDLANGTLPQVVLIEPASDVGLDEHGSDYDMYPINIQLGAKYASGIINSVMTSSAWPSTAIIFTYDEYGGIYDHYSPQPAVSPDNIAPSDLKSTDICYGIPGTGTCNFTYTGYRVPLIVISPYAKKNYVSHLPMDTTAWLKAVELRFNVGALTNRDNAQPSMWDEFFDFNNPQWLTPPSPPTQLTNGACYLNQLP